jgi:serpin B
VEDGYPLLDSYQGLLRRVFALEGNRGDFRGQSGEACRLINGWTGERTGGKITDVLRPEDLHPRTRMVLTTALYFRANWREAFWRKLTRTEPFHITPGKMVDVPMMNDHSYAEVHGYFDGDSFQALALPCGSGGEFEMVVLLPRRTDGLSGLEATLTPESLDRWRAEFRQPEEIIIALPKYRLSNTVSLNRLLSEIGMPLAFDPLANFSGINGKSADLFLAATAHSTLIDVNEEGIEAAAEMHAISPDAYGEEPPVFRADHPFVFLVRDTRSGCILFIGRVVNPLDVSCGVTS